MALTKGRPLAVPVSIVATLAPTPVASRNASKGERGRPRCSASPLPEPHGTSASAVGVPMSPCATSLTVPSPPTATTTAQPARAARAAICVACPGPSVIAKSASTPRVRMKSRM